MSEGRCLYRYRQVKKARSNRAFFRPAAMTFRRAVDADAQLACEAQPSRAMPTQVIAIARALPTPALGRCARQNVRSGAKATGGMAFSRLRLGAHHAGE